VLPDRRRLEAIVAEAEARLADAPEIALPPHWGGYRVRPRSIEFWQGQRSRLHDRLRYERDDGGAWSIVRLAP
jgi:pyridoxamine 5'-phosphate oxidase